MAKWCFSALLLWVFLASVIASGAEIEAVVDADGREVEVEEPFQRIISLYPAHTENLFSLGLDREIIGVGPGDDFPASARAKPRFSYRAGPERFLAARPDLVLIRPMIARGYPDLVARLRQAGVTVVSLQPRSVAEMYKYWLALGMLTGREQEARAMIRVFRRELAGIGRMVERIPRSARQRVYFEAIHSRMKTFAPTSMAVFVLESAGGINVAGDALQVRGSNIAAYGKERILARAEEIDVFLAQRGRMNRVDVATIMQEPGFGAIRAVREGRVHLIDEKLVSRPTMRLLQGIRRIGRILYPAVFSSGEDAE